MKVPGQFVVLSSVALIIFLVLLSFIIKVPHSEAPAETVATSTSAHKSKVLDITNVTKGYLYFFYQYQDLAEAPEPFSITLRFYHEDKGTYTDIKRYSERSGMDYPASNFTFFNNNLYLINGSGSLVTIRKDYSDEVVPVDLRPGEYISDYLFDDDKVYYLAGPYCGDYMGICNNALRVYSYTTDTTTSLAYNLGEGRLSGFNNDHTKLYLEKNFADAGYFLADFEIFNFKTNATEDGPLFEGSVEIPSSANQVEAYKNFASSLVPKITDTDALRWNGASFEQNNSSEVIEGAELIKVY